MRLIPLLLTMTLAAGPAALLAQSSAQSSSLFSTVHSIDGAAEDGGDSQMAPSAYRTAAFTRLTLGGGVSPLGTGVAVATNLSPHLDLRGIGNIFNFNYDFQQSGFNIHVNADLVNAGVLADYYPFHKGFRISPGFLFHNTNRVRADLAAGPGATFTINDVTWNSDDADPVHGTGRLLLGGSGFMVTAGYGHIVSRSHRHFTFPFEAGVAFIHTPLATLDLAGKICSSQGTNCQEAAAYPGFASNLAAQLVKWNHDAAPFHIYPIVSGGIAYTFRIRQ